MNKEDSKGGSDEVVEVEQYSKAGKPVPPGKRYEIRVDKDKFTIEGSRIKGVEVLGLVGKTPDIHNLYLHLRGGQTRPIPANEDVDLTEPGVERFSTIKRQNQEGEERTARRSFKLPADDEEFLNANFESWEAIIEGGVQWVLIPNFPVPAGFNVGECRVALRIEPGYPDVQIDMAYVEPSLARADAKPIRNLSAIALDGANFQQWSRHRDAGDWRPGLDCLQTHLLYVTAFLEGELQK